MNGALTTLAATCTALSFALAPAAQADAVPDSGASVTNGQTRRYVDWFSTEGLCGVDFGGFNSVRGSLTQVVPSGRGTFTSKTISTTYYDKRVGPSVSFTITPARRAHLTDKQFCAVVMPALGFASWGDRP